MQFICMPISISCSFQYRKGFPANSAIGGTIPPSPSNRFTLINCRSARLYRVTRNQSNLEIASWPSFVLCVEWAPFQAYDGLCINNTLGQSKNKVECVTSIVAIAAALIGLAYAPSQARHEEGRQQKRDIKYESLVSSAQCKLDVLQVPGRMQHVENGVNQAMNASVR